MNPHKDKTPKDVITQEENYRWWNENPMRYDWGEKVPFEEFSKEFFIEIDKRFFANSREYLPWKNIPFDSLVDFESLRNKSVLEIGVGNGTHAQLLAAHAKSFVGIDLTDYAVRSTTERLRVFDLPGAIMKMDAERLEFSDNSFDFVWSWGVIHHSADTGKILKEISRVLRPGGTAAIMVYYRGWWNYYTVGLLGGLVSGRLIKTHSLFKTIQSFTDGAIARYYRFSDWRDITSGLFRIRRIMVLGPKTDIVPLPGGGLKNMMMRRIPNSLGRFLTNKLRMGSFLYSTLEKRP